MYTCVCVWSDGGHDNERSKDKGETGTKRMLYVGTENGTKNKEWEERGVEVRDFSRKDEGYNTNCMHLMVNGKAAELYCSSANIFNARTWSELSAERGPELCSRQDEH